MSLSSTALVKLTQAKQYLKLDAAANEIIEAEGVAGSVIKGWIYKNGTALPRLRAERKFGNNDLGSMAGGGQFNLAAGDVVWTAMESNGTNDLTAKVVSFQLHRL